ncbi:MAG: helix-turn-helix domain-containing protein [Fidelibacterota bacterium]|nr:MAG: helix-turn-helix domain-containing protein [Candidatus Neomarinimicrobiota bacterium]
MYYGPSDTEVILMHLDSLEELFIKTVPTTPWMTTKEAAEFLRCSVSKVEQLVYKGLLPYKRLDVTCERSPRLFHRKHLAGYLVAVRNPERYRLPPTDQKKVDDLLL